MPSKEPLRKRKFSEITPSQFYVSVASKHKVEHAPSRELTEPPQWFELETKRLRMNVLKKRDKDRILNISKLFAKQKDAIHYMKAVLDNVDKDLSFNDEKHRQELRALCVEQLFIFSFQWNNSMSGEQYGPVMWSNFTDFFPQNFQSKAYRLQERYFMVASLQNFWEKYSIWPIHMRHFYEIIREDCRCFLYFDIEADLTKNPQFVKTGGQDCAIPLLIDQLTQFLEKDHPLSVDFPVLLDDKDVLDLDSSTPKKFSRHLIVRLTMLDGNERRLCAFENNHVHMSQFVRKFVNYLRGLRASSSDVDRFLFVSKLYYEEYGEEPIRDTCIIDEGVYTRNRAFRLFMSKKYDPQESYRCIPLDVSSTNKFQFKDQRDCFMHSLVTNVSLTETIMTLTATSGKETKSDTNRPFRVIPDQTDSRFQRLDEKDLEKLHNFIVDIIKKGFVRSYQYNNRNQTIIYNIGGNRYCGNTKYLIG